MRMSRPGGPVQPNSSRSSSELRSPWRVLWEKRAIGENLEAEFEVILGEDGVDGGRLGRFLTVCAGGHHPPHCSRTPAAGNGLKLLTQRSDVQRAMLGAAPRPAGTRMTAIVTPVLQAPGRGEVGAPPRHVPASGSRQRSGIRAAPSVGHLLLGIASKSSTRPMSSRSNRANR